MLTTQTTFSKKLLFITGKGGSGKTTTAALIAYQAAHAGKKVLIAESTAYSQIPQLFDKPPSSFIVQQLADGISGINLDSNSCFKDYVVNYLKLHSLYRTIFSNAAVKAFLTAIPALGELMLLGKLYFLSCESNKYDLIIYDAPSSGHFLNLLRTPQIVLESGLVGPLIKEVKKIYACLADQNHCGCILTTLPKSLVISETFEYLPLLQKQTPINILGIIINRSAQDYANDIKKLTQPLDNNHEVDSTQATQKNTLTNSKLLAQFIASNWEQRLYLANNLRRQLKQFPISEIKDFGTTINLEQFTKIKIFAERIK